MAGELLANIIAKTKVPESELTDLVNGTVVSTEPLKIRIEGGILFKSFEIPESKILLHQSCKNLKIDNSLRILRCNKGQTFYVLEKISQDDESEG